MPVALAADEIAYLLQSGRGEAWQEVEQLLPTEEDEELDPYADHGPQEW